ncbi:DUF1045 domain-containing protein [Roseovarius sp. Pro17]|uniref:DUF1045 domain-containing protein n=1 Tax=Roseovarius sp. Pro17 TaxID=3108175 RepID=UPI002D769C07|nr:DUF1045 domain-containing protein [Roseovarius sp. Pro17]
MPDPALYRYGIYYTPPDGALACFGAAWLGWNIASGQSAPHPEDITGLPTSIAELTETPRRYGFHATIKPPFRLAQGAQPEALYDALANFCAARTPVTLDGTKLARLGRFVAIVPTGDTGALDRLAADTVRQLDPFRAALTAAEIARRTHPRMSAAQSENLHRWGYPHVMDQFRWHMTLTGKRPAPEAARVQAALTPALAPLLARPLVIDALSLVGEDNDGFFHLIHRAPLGR